MQTLAQYIADFIAEELDRGALIADIDADMIARAIQAYEGGAGETSC